MAKKKKAAKAVDPAPEVEVEATEGGEGEEVEVEEAIVEEATIKVRGTAVGGVKMMTQTEYNEYCGKK